MHYSRSWHVVTLMVVVFSFEGALAQDEVEATFPHSERLAELKTQIKQMRTEVAIHKPLAAAEKRLSKKIARLKESKQLTDAQVKHLLTAAKGAVKQHAAWLKSQEEDPDGDPEWAEDISDYCWRRGDVIFLGDEMPGSMVLHEPIWVNAIRSLRTAEELAERRARQAFRHDVIMGLLTYKLDKKLKLTADQRPQMTALLTDSVASRMRKIKCTSEYLMIYPMVHFVSEIPEETLQKILTEEQMNQWPEAVQKLRQ